MEKNKIKIKPGDIIKFTSPYNDHCTTIALMETENWIAAAMNFRGREDEQNRIWMSDSLPEEAVNIQMADGFDRAMMIDNLIKDGQDIVVIRGHIFLADLEITNDVCKAMGMKPALPEKYERFKSYITDLMLLYRQHGSLRGMSGVRNAHHIGGITKEQFFAKGLHNMQLSQLTDEFIIEFRNETVKR